ncbi:flagellar hook-associated protein 3 FlgL [Salsuginibacillus halophilus]|uniref:Flagellar hook-associated protein 3 FlgL n=1 Tax=Salsuginibacillus halophilus TaxID=517424 RepID=A0A2P8HQW8_9BACI|nr:flagellar hook-associated protein FlgL [Salsuginibacillus halophilus]PSL48572.1 flagellar hook-associated protein 3 FlgL [Salsuginibacillus halophilus]
MRTTESMLANNSINHLQNNFRNLGDLQDQLSTGKKITRPSQDPVVAMNGMKHRSTVREVEQFQRNVNTAHNWMEEADSALSSTTDALHRVRELTTQAANDSYDTGERQDMAEEIGQLMEQLESMANTRSNDKYIFNGTDTTNAPADLDGVGVGTGALEADDDNLEEHEITFNGSLYTFDELDGQDATFTSEEGDEITVDFSEDREITHTADGEETTLSEGDISVNRTDAVSSNSQDVELELLKGVDIPVNVNPENVFNNGLFGDLQQIKQTLEDPDASGEELSGMIDVVQGHIDSTVSEQAELGARVNRIEMMESRLADQEVTATRMMSENEDADMEEVIIELQQQENVHQAALSSGARIMQPTLMDFLN